MRMAPNTCARSAATCGTGLCGRRARCMPPPRATRAVGSNNGARPATCVFVVFGVCERDKDGGEAALFPQRQFDETASATTRSGAPAAHREHVPSMRIMRITAKRSLHVANRHPSAQRVVPAECMAPLSCRPVGGSERFCAAHRGQASEY